MTSKQLFNHAIRHDMTDAEIDDLASQLAASPCGRKAAGKALSSGKRQVSIETRRERSLAMKELNKQRKLARLNKRGEV